MTICSNRYEARSGPARELWLHDRNSKPEHGEQLGSLKGKTALVTDSRSGIGLARARAFASAGANIVFNGMVRTRGRERAICGLAAKANLRVSVTGDDRDWGSRGSRS